MSNVLIDRQKIDILANAISDKSGVPVTMTLDEMVEAVDGIETGGGITPTGNIDITNAGVTDVTNYATATVPQGEIYVGIGDIGFYTENNQKKWKCRASGGVESIDDCGEEGYIADHTWARSPYLTYNAIPSGTTITPTESAQTIGGVNYHMEGAVTVNAIPSNYVGSGITRRDSTDLSASGATVTVPSGYYSAQVSKSVATMTLPTSAASSATSGYVSKATIGRSTAAQYINIPPGYNSTGAYYVISAVADGSATGPSSLSGSSATITTGTNTITLTKTGVTTTPTVSAGYVSSATASTATVALTASVTVNPTPTASGKTVTIPAGYYSTQTTKSVANGSAGTPTATKVVDTDDASALITPSVTNTSGYITGGTKTGTSFYVTARELVSGTTVTCDEARNWDVAEVETLVVPSGTAGTPTATKGTVSNHSISVTPSVTNTSGYITGSTKTGTAVTVSASELVSGSQTVTSNQTVDVTNLAEVVVNVSGGSGTPMQIETDIVASSYTSSTLTFTGLKGEPKAFWVIHGAAIATGTPSKVASIVFDGTTMHGQIVTNTSNAQASYSTNFSYTYSNGTLTITSSNATFISANYIITYAYGGGAVDTKDVQVGSGATSITFTGLEAEPALWSCIFKSNFSTSNGYQRVMYVEHEDDFTIGFYMDSSANPNPTYWSYSYNNGSLTITSQGTNAGGYFHQPGYYQLTYAYDDGSSGNYQSKTVTPTTSQQVVEADSGYDALKRVTVNAMPSGSATAPASISGTAASVSTGTNTLTLTKTVSVTPTVSAGYINSGTAGNSSVSLTASVTTKAAATITPTTTNQTIAAGTYLTGTQTIAGDADLVGSNILSTANIFGVQGTVVVQNYYTGSSAPSSSLGSNGDLYLQA